MTLDRKGTGGSGTRRVRFQSPEELLLQERLDAAQAIPGKAETRAKLQALHQQDKADRQLKQQQEATSRATAIAAVSQAEPTARTDRQLTGFFAYNIEGLYSNGKLDYAALKARLQAHTPGVRSPQSAGSAAGPTRPGNEHPTASSPGPAEQQQQQQPSPLSIDAGAERSDPESCSQQPTRNVAEASWHMLAGQLLTDRHSVRRLTSNWPD